MKHPFDRRTFLKLGALTGIASTVSAATSPERQQHANTPQHSSVDAQVRRYVRLGRTEMKISDISFGSSRLRQGEENLVQHALARGINYFDTAESYTDTVSETVIGNALKGKRDQVYIATKAFSGGSTRKSQIMASLDASLRRLQTDYVDLYFNHAVNDVDRLQNDEWFEFTELARRQGKLRYTGLSGHAGKLVEVCDYALEHNLVDVLLLAHNFGQDPSFYEQFTRSFDFVANQPDLPRIMRRAREKDVGVIAMKVLRGARLNDMRPFEKTGATYAQAAFKWVAGLDYVDASIISMTSTSDIDEYLGASGQTALTDEDFRLLETYARNTNMTYCRHACNDCEGACPYGVPIADVLRTRMYATDYQDVDFAQSEYQQLPTNADACLSCDGSPCRDACSHGIDVASLCGPTHLLLS